MTRRLLASALLLGFALSASAGTVAKRQPQPSLVSTAQLQALAKAAGGGTVASGLQRVPLKTRGPVVDDGPRITLVSPAEGAKVTPPLQVELAFEPRGAAVNLSTLQVRYVLSKGDLAFELDVTEQARKLFTLQGAKLWVPEAAPKGVHVIRVAVKDEGGKATEGQFSLEVQ